MILPAFSKIPILWKTRSSFAFPLRAGYKKGDPPLFPFCFNDNTNRQKHFLCLLKNKRRGGMGAVSASRQSAKQTAGCLWYGECGSGSCRPDDLRDALAALAPSATQTGDAIRTLAATVGAATTGLGAGSAPPVLFQTVRTGRTGRIARARAGPPRPAVAVAVPRRVGSVRSVEGRLGRNEPRRNGRAAVAGGAIRGGPDHERRRVADQPARARRRWRPLVERLAQRRSDQPTQRQARGVRSVAALARCGSHSSSRASSSSRPLTLRPS